MLLYHFLADNPMKFISLLNGTYWSKRYKKNLEFY